MKRILITNDDGILAGGIIRLAEAACAFGEVTVIAPAAERSGLSRSITIRKPIDLVPHAFPVPGVTAWACSGTPSDCVRIGLEYLLPHKPDLVLSGINAGFNTGDDIPHSATTGAAFEAVHLGVPAIAFSEPFEPVPEVTARYLPGILSDLMNQGPGRDAVFNVNFPAAPCRGILTGRTVSFGSMFRTRYRLLEKLPENGLRLETDNTPDPGCEEGSDYRAVQDHYISVGIVKNIG